MSAASDAPRPRGGAASERERAEPEHASEAATRPTPREWIGEAPYPWPPTARLNAGDEVLACFSIVGVNATHARDGSTLLRLQLSDCYGTVEARVWDTPAGMLPPLSPGLYLGVRGRIEESPAERYIAVDTLAPLHVELDDLVLFLPRSARPAETMDAELHALIASISDEPLRRLTLALLGPKRDTGRGFRLAPAAKQKHHAYLGGLLEHTISVARICDALAAHYGPRIDRDLLITGALLHDVGKVREIGARSGFPYTDEGKLLGHILLGLQLIADAAADIPQLSAQRLLLVQHLVASHQGRYEWHSPREPHTMEALVLHYADDLDAKLNQVSALLGAVEQGWTAYDRGFGRDFLRHRPAAEEAELRASAEAAARADSRRTTSLETLDLFE